MDRVRKGTNSAMLIILVYGLASAFILHFTDVQIMGLFLDTAKEVDIVAMGRQYLSGTVCFIAAGCAGLSGATRSRGWASPRAGNAGRCGGNDCPHGGCHYPGAHPRYFGAELANPAAWVAACLFLYPAYRWTCSQLDNRLLAPNCPSRATTRRQCCKSKITRPFRIRAVFFCMHPLPFCPKTYIINII